MSVSDKHLRRVIVQQRTSTVLNVTLQGCNRSTHSDVSRGNSLKLTRSPRHREQRGAKSSRYTYYCSLDRLIQRFPRAVAIINENGWSVAQSLYRFPLLTQTLDIPSGGRHLLVHDAQYPAHQVDSHWPAPITRSSQPRHPFRQRHRCLYLPARLYCWLRRHWGCICGHSLCCAACALLPGVLRAHERCAMEAEHQLCGILHGSPRGYELGPSQYL